MHSYKNSPIPDDTPGIATIRFDRLTLFEQSTGWMFRVKGTGQPGIHDIIAGIDWHESLVIGKEGKYHIDLCEITGQTIPADHKSAEQMLSALDEDPDFFTAPEFDY